MTADFPFWSAGYVAHPDLAESHRAHGTAHSSCGRVIPGWKLAVADTATQESRLADTTGWTHHVAVAPSRFAIEGARAYANLKGFTDPHDTDYSQIMQSPERVSRVGRHYDSLPVYSPAAVPHFAAMQKEVNDQYDFLTNNMGIKVQSVDYDPYAHVGEMMADVHNNGTLKVLGSHITGGHPVFGQDDNDKFRAVHDFFGHAATGRDFDRHGEHATYLAHSRMFSPEALPALTTETLGQNSSLILNGHFGPNKIGVIPRELTAARTAMPWYHVSPHDLPVGTQLVPGGGDSPLGFDDDRSHVWVAPDTSWASEYVSYDPEDHDFQKPINPFIYEVEPESDPRPIGAENDPNPGGQGWVTPSAVIKRVHQKGGRPRHAARTAMPAPLPKGITFHHHSEDDGLPRWIRNHGRDHDIDLEAPAVEARHNGKPVGYLAWDYDRYPAPTMIYTHPDYRRQSIGTALWDFARQHEPDLEHSEHLTDLGDQWVRYEQTRTAAHRTPDELAQAGYVTDDWDKWQGGGCLEYAHALHQKYPHLGIGALVEHDGEFTREQHFFAHDDDYAYDSAGRHSLPYRGVHDDFDMQSGIDLDDFDEPDPNLVAEARQHIDRHGIGPHTAYRTAMPYDDNEEDEDEDDGTYCKDCGKGDGDWCEDCETCAHCDSGHEDHCKSCGPNDSDWCEDCGQCSNCDWEHDAHCSYCGPNDSEWCEDCGQCNNCDGICEHRESDSRPSSLNSPLFRDRERPLTNEYTSQGERMHLFLPHDVNPASEAVSRPYIDFEREPDHYNTPALDLKLPPARWTNHDRPLHEHSNGIDGIPPKSRGAELYRGLTVDLKHPDLHSLRRALYGDEKESLYGGDPNSSYHPKRRFEPRKPHQPGMFPGPYSDKELAAGPVHPDRLHGYLDTLLGHMDNHRGLRGGLGVHWSTDIGQANQFANANSPFNNENGHLPVRMKARWFGRGEDPYRRNTGEETPGDYEYEQELSMLKNAPLNLTDLEIFHPKTKQWHSLMDGEPRRIHAGRDFFGALEEQFPDVMALLRDRKE